MFIGHFAAGFAGKKTDGGPSLGTFFLAAQFMDVLWPVFLLLGIEQAQIVDSHNPFLNLKLTFFPYSHSLLASLVYSVLFGVGYYLLKKNRRGAVILGAVVFSHWILDFISHEPDLQLMPGLEWRVGLGLWDSEVMTVLVEVALFAIGAYLYMRWTNAKNTRGRIGAWGLLIFLMVLYILNLASPPPPSLSAVGYAGLSGWLLILWAYWIDRNRRSISEPLQKAEVA